MATVLDVETERDRRLALGFDYDFGDVRGVHRIGTSENDMKGWNEVTTLSNAILASSAILSANNSYPMINILTNTGLVAISASEWMQICIAAAAFRQPIWGASFIISAMDPIPEDYIDDIYWTVP